MMKESTKCFRNQTNSNWDDRKLFPRAQDVVKKKIYYFYNTCLFVCHTEIVEFSQTDTIVSS